MNTKIDCSPFTGFNDLFFNLFLYFIHNLLNAGRVNTSVGNELMKRQAGNFAPNRAKSRQYNCFGGTINNYLNSSTSLQRTDVTAFTPDDPTFDFVTFDMKNCNRVFDRCFGCDTLNPVSYTHLRAHETDSYLVCRL